jgi:hypothetical protein
MTIDKLDILVAFIFLPLNTLKTFYIFIEVNHPPTITGAPLMLRGVTLTALM